MTDDQIIAKGRRWACLARPSVEVDDVQIVPWGKGRAICVSWRDGQATAWGLDEYDAWNDPIPLAGFDDPAVYG